MFTQTLHIPPIVLDWSTWVAWNDLKLDARSPGGVTVPNKVPGIYEVRCKHAQERLHIGRASNLRMRVKRGLVKGKVPHSTGKRIRASEDVSRIVVRWAVTGRPAAAEEELHRQHRAEFGRLPKHTRRT